MYKNIKYVCRSNGAFEDFDISKLQESIENILKSVNEYSEHEQFIFMTAKKISFIVADKLNSNKITGDHDTVAADDIYDYVCDELFGIGYNQTAKQYIVDRYKKIISEKDKLISSLKNELCTYITGDQNESN